MDGTVSRVLDTIDELGEGPVWDSASGALCWFDVINRVLHRFSPEGDANSDVRLQKMPGALAMRRNGGFLLTFRNGIGVADRWGEAFRPVEGHGIDFDLERINDGAVDRNGRLWFGTFSPRVESGRGSLYRLDPDMTVRRMDSGITMSNGIAWSPDDQAMYFADSRPGCVYRYPFRPETGEIGPREVFIDYSNRPGRPDGCAVDSEGYLWVAEVTAGRVARYSPDGELARIIEVPASRPTSLAFGGTDLRTLFITTMRYGMTKEELEQEPLAGALFKVDLEVAGMPEPRFAG